MLRRLSRTSSLRPLLRMLAERYRWSRLTRPQSSLLRKERSARGDGKEEERETTGDESVVKGNEDAGYEGDGD